MSEKIEKKRLAVNVVAAGSLLLAGATPFVDAASAYAAPDAAQPEVLVVESALESADVMAADANQGRVSWDQATITPNSVIKAVFAKAVAVLCGSHSALVVDNPLQWKLSVSGDVENAFTATVDELAQDQSVINTMTCTCGGNPADGRAIITAEVTGIPVNYLAGRAGATSECNTITFVASDGTEVAMPLAYVIGRHGVISYEVNGEDLSASVGGSNQLWLEGTAAKYFVRDIVEVRITAEDEAPAAPGEGKQYPNSPNVGMTASSVL